MGVIISISAIQLWELNKSVIHSTFTECLLCARPCAGHWRYGYGHRNPSQIDLTGKSSRVWALGLLDPEAPSTLSRLGLFPSVSLLYFPLFEFTLCWILFTPAHHQPSQRKSISHPSSSSKGSRLCLISLS